MQSFFSNLLAVVFIMLNLNAVMSVIFNVPAAIFSTVCDNLNILTITKLIFP